MPIEEFSTTASDRESFEWIRSQHATREEALVAYAKRMSSRYSLQKARAAGSQKIIEARWVVFEGSGCAFGPANLLLLFTGVISFSTRNNRFQYCTYHPLSGDGSSVKGRLFLGYVLEAVATVLLLPVLACLVVGVMSLFMSSFESITTPVKALLLAVGVLGGIGYRILLRHAKKVRIPTAAMRDASSPFYLTSIKKIAT